MANNSIKFIYGMLYFVQFSLCGFTITYESGPYQKIDIAITRNEKDIKSFLWHAKNMFGIKEDVYIAPKVLAPAGALAGTALTAYGVTQSNELIDRADDFSDAIADATNSETVGLIGGLGAIGGVAAVGGGIGSSIGYGIGMAIDPASELMFNKVIKKIYKADYITDVSVGTKCGLTKNDIKSNDMLLLKDGKYGPISYAVILRDKKRLSIIGVGQIYPCGTYTLSIQEYEQNPRIYLEEVARGGDSTCR